MGRSCRTAYGHKKVALMGRVLALAALCGLLALVEGQSGQVKSQVELPSHYTPVTNSDAASRYQRSSGTTTSGSSAGYGSPWSSGEGDDDDDDDDSSEQYVDDEEPYELVVVDADPRSQQRTLVKSLKERKRKIIKKIARDLGRGGSIPEVDNYRVVRQGWVSFSAFFRAWSAADFEFLVSLPRECPLLAEYVGEELPGNRAWRRKMHKVNGMDAQTCDFVPVAERGDGPVTESCQVTYFSDAIRRRKRVVFVNGLFARPAALIGRGNKEPILLNAAQTKKMALTLTGDQKDLFTNFDVNLNQVLGDFLYVQTVDGTLYVSPFQSMGTFHHSSLARGQLVLAAGTMRFVNGKLVHVSNQSGHYKPHPMALYRFLLFLMSNGVAIDESVTIELHANPKTVRRITEAREGVRFVSLSDDLQLSMAKQTFKLMHAEDQKKLSQAKQELASTKQSGVQDGVVPRLAQGDAPPPIPQGTAPYTGVVVN
jgi:hypothetical protein